MITVRFATGFSIQYNTATFLDPRPSEGMARILTKKDGDLIARVPMAACVIEWTPACRTYQAINAPTIEVEAELRAMRKEIASLKRAIAKAAKQ